MVLKLKSRRQTFKTFLGSYWIHGNQYKGQGGHLTIRVLVIEITSLP